MKILIVLILSLLFATQCFADASSVEITTMLGDTPYKLMQKVDGVNTCVGYYVGEDEVTEQEYQDYQSDLVLKESWNPDTFLSIVMSQFLTPELMIHKDIVMRASDRNTVEAWETLGAYAIAMDLVDLATQIEELAKSMGANIN